MYARVVTAIALAVLSTAAAPALAGNYAYFDRPDAANPNSHAAVSNDSYVRAFSWAWGDLQFSPDKSESPIAPTPAERRQARDGVSDPRDLTPGHFPQEDNATPRGRRGKVGMT